MVLASAAPPSRVPPSPQSTSSRSSPTRPRARSRKEPPLLDILHPPASPNRPFLPQRFKAPEDADQQEQGGDMIYTHGSFLNSSFAPPCLIGLTDERINEYNARYAQVDRIVEAKSLEIDTMLAEVRDECARRAQSRAPPARPSLRRRQDWLARFQATEEHLRKQHEEECLQMAARSKEALAKLTARAKQDLERERESRVREAAAKIIADAQAARKRAEEDNAKKAADAEAAAREAAEAQAEAQQAQAAADAAGLAQQASSGAQTSAAAQSQSPVPPPPRPLNAFGVSASPEPTVPGDFQLSVSAPAAPAAVPQPPPAAALQMSPPPAQQKPQAAAAAEPIPEHFNITKGSWGVLLVSTKTLAEVAACESQVNIKTDPNLSGLPRAIRKTVNQIAIDPVSVLDKAHKLCEICASVQEPARTCVMWHVVKDLVEQGTAMIAQNVKSAFPIGAVAVVLSQHFAGFCRLFLARLHQQCIYTVPYHIRQAPGMTDAEHRAALGFVAQSTGEPEDFERYIERMTGMVALYAAFIQTPLRAWMNKDHPHGLSHAEMWVKRVLAMSKFPAAPFVLHAFLEVAGHEMTYARPQQVLAIVAEVQAYAASFEKTVNNQAGLARLTMLCSEALKLKVIPAFGPVLLQEPQQN
eukprot:m51a1_g2572 hypothetical protein (641) ;mRNA; r:379449-382177